MTRKHTVCSCAMNGSRGNKMVPSTTIFCVFGRSMCSMYLIRSCRSGLSSSGMILPHVSLNTKTEYFRTFRHVLVSGANMKGGEEKQERLSMVSYSYARTDYVRGIHGMKWCGMAWCGAWELDKVRLRSSHSMLLAITESHEMRLIYCK